MSLTEQVSHYIAHRLQVQYKLLDTDILLYCMRYNIHMTIKRMNLTDCRKNDHNSSRKDQTRKFSKHFTFLIVHNASYSEKFLASILFIYIRGDACLLDVLRILNLDL